MKIIRVQYTVKEDYIETNQQNIVAVMEELRSLNNPKIKYSAFLMDDGKTFMHFAMYPDEATAKIVPSLKSFAHFRTSLKASQPEVPPLAKEFSLVASASAYDIF